MRILGEFFAGITSVIFSRSDTSCPKGRVHARPQPKSRAFLDILLRILLLLVCLGIVAVTLLSTGSKPLGSSKAAEFENSSATAVSNNMVDILAVDSSAKPRVWRYIVIHHSASAGGSAQSFDQYHRDVRKWEGLAYQFVIGNGNGQGDGSIIAGPRWYNQEAGAHANSTLYNEHGIGICLVGNFDEKPATSAQMTALRDLVGRLCAKYEIGFINIVGHNQIRAGGSTACPGKFFSIAEFRSSIDRH